MLPIRTLYPTTVVFRYNRSDWDLLFKLAKTAKGATLAGYLNNFGHPLPNGKRDLNNGGIISTARHRRHCFLP